MKKSLKTIPIILIVLLFFCQTGFMIKNYYDNINQIKNQNELLICKNDSLHNKIKIDSLEIDEYKHFIKAISDANYTFYVTVTMYNAKESQCDSSPLITADNTFIVKEKIDDLKYIAISRDLHKRYGGPFEFNDKLLLLNAGDKNGVYIIKDLMNRRFKRRIDILETDYADEYKFKNAFIIDLKSSKLSKELNGIINKNEYSISKRMF